MQSKSKAKAKQKQSNSKATAKQKQSKSKSKAKAKAKQKQSKTKAKQKNNNPVFSLESLGSNRTAPNGKTQHSQQSAIQKKDWNVGIVICFIPARRKHSQLHTLFWQARLTAACSALWKELTVCKATTFGGRRLYG